jgi:hypothetical protein
MFGTLLHREAEGAEEFSPGFELHNANLSKASAVESILSRRDSTIVARHEVPGIMKKIAPSQRDD